MQTIKNKAVKLFMFLAIISITVSGYAQAKHDNDAEAKVDIEELLKAKKFVFVAENMTPMGGRNMFLTSYYNVLVNEDELQSDLPYFGRAYSAPINPTKSALQFSSEDFQYNLEQTRKKAWSIKITPKDNNEVREMYLTIYPNGVAYLQVLSNNRQPITFDGRIEELPDNKK